LDCLHGNKVRLISDKWYQLDKAIARVRRGEEDKGRHRARFEDGVKEHDEFFGNRKLQALPVCERRHYHIYTCDKTFFEHKVILTRISLANNVVERHTIYLFESNTGFPHFYKVGSKTQTARRSVIYFREEGNPADFQTKFAVFKKFFKEKAGIEWDQRCDGIKGGDDDWHYLPPTGGRPVGQLPYGWIPPVVEVEAGGDEQSATAEDVVYDTESKTSGMDID